MTPAFPSMLRRWRAARRLTQAQLAEQAEISARHLSFMENGRASPSRTMVLVLANALDLDLRERNHLLGAAGFAAVYTAHGLESLSLAPVRRAIQLIMEQQEPFGAVLLDRCWSPLRFNRGAERLLAPFLADGVPPQVAENMLRLSFHPEGLRRYIVNWREVAATTLTRLHKEVAQHPADEARRALLTELLSYPGAAELPTVMEPSAPVVVLHMRRGALELRLLTTLTTLGTPLDVSAAELTIECFFPADDATERWLRDQAG